MLSLSCDESQSIRLECFPYSRAWHCVRVLIPLGTYKAAIGLRPRLPIFITVIFSSCHWKSTNHNAEANIAHIMKLKTADMIASRSRAWDRRAIGEYVMSWVATRANWIHRVVRRLWRGSKVAALETLTLLFTRPMPAGAISVEITTSLRFQFESWHRVGLYHCVVE